MRLPNYKITEQNYFEYTKGVFEIVKDKKEIEKIFKLTANHTNQKSTLFWESQFNFDAVFLMEDKELTEEEKEEGVIGKAINFEEDEEYNFYIFHKEGNNLQASADLQGVKIISKTWLYNGYVYRWADYWGCLGTCNWDLDDPNYIEGKQAEYVLAKIKIENLEN